MFVTVSGDILPCEKIEHQFSFGEITEDKVILDMQEVADKFNALLAKIKPKCRSCHTIKKCSQCVYFIDKISSDPNPECFGYMTAEAFDRYVSKNMTYLSKNPQLFEDIIMDAQ